MNIISTYEAASVAGGLQNDLEINSPAAQLIQIACREATAIKSDRITDDTHSLLINLDGLTLLLNNICSLAPPPTQSA